MVWIDIIKAAINDREDELRRKFQQEKIITREAAERLQLSTDAVLIITGVRRCGKSTLAYMLSEGVASAYINFEDERLAITSSELNTVLEAVQMIKGDVDLFIFDEIQNVVGWERFVARLLPAKKIIVTGSNARLLSRELATFLTGRHIDLSLFPFSFSEFCRWKGFTFTHRTKDLAQVKSYLQEYLEKGGFPLAYKLGKVFLLETYKDILERDIIQRYKIRYVKAFKEISKYLISNFGKELSYNQLRKVFMIKSVHTISNYVSYLQSAYLILLVERFSFKLKEQTLAPRKAYCIDAGMINAVAFGTSVDFGRMMENIVAVELWRKKQEFYYWRDYQQREVDFVVKEGKKIVQLIQVCPDLSHLQTKKREVESILRSSRELKCKNMLIITGDYESEEVYTGLKILFIPLWKWLLQK